MKSLYGLGACVCSFLLPQSAVPRTHSQCGTRPTTYGWNETAIQSETERKQMLGWQSSVGVFYFECRPSPPQIHRTNTCDCTAISSFFIRPISFHRFSTHTQPLFLHRGCSADHAEGAPPAEIHFVVNMRDFVEYSRVSCVTPI